MSIVLLCYNDAATIAPLVETAEAAARAVAEEFELIVVDDGSTDGSRDRLQDLQPRHPRLRVVRHARNQGYGAALRTGLRAATKSLVFYTDGDGQYDIAELRALWPLMREGVDVVNGYKRSRRDPLLRRLLGEGYRRLARWAFRLPVRDVNCDFRLIRRQRLEQVELTCDSGAIGVELVTKLALAGGTFVERAVPHYPRRYGRSQFFEAGRIWQTVREVGRLWWHVRR